ncbi:MAG: sulfotransferase [Bacteroidetes bacterium]|nr:sulfotransferase [Bacteroidota bacterium]
MNTKVIVIAGMHRSGTSVVAQWLQRCGLSIGTKLEGPGIGNEQGHFEDADFLHLHQKLLSRRSLSETGFVSKPMTTVTELEKMEMSDLIELKNRKNKEWGWKDPRTCLFLDMYSELLPEAYYIVVVRDFNATVSSMITREFKMLEKRYHTKKGFSKLKWKLFKRKSMEQLCEKYADRYLKVWIHYYEKLLSFISTLPENRFTFVSYKELLRNDGAVFATLKKDRLESFYYVPFTSVYKKELLSDVTDVMPFVKDKALIRKAIAIQQQVHLYYLPFENTTALQEVTGAAV